MPLCFRLRSSPRHLQIQGRRHLQALHVGGLRIRDAVTLEKTRLEGNKLFLYQAKTGVPVYVVLPPEVVEALQTLPPGPKPNPRYFFWSGNGNPKSVWPIGSWPIEDSSKWLRSRSRTELRSAAIPICSAIPSRSNYSSQGSPSTRSRSCSVTRVSRSRRNTMLLGQGAPGPVGEKRTGRMAQRR
jgi:hypothetical protein